MTEATQEPRTPARTAFQSRLAAICGDIKVAHSVFALPFALLATFLAPQYTDDPLTVAKVAIIVVCMVFARTYAMLANRYLDRDIDARNPRTANRAIPAGRLRPGEMLAATVVCAIGLFAAAAMFGVLYANWWPTVFAPLVLLWLGAYGLMKRFTLLCHFFLGAALAISPLAAALAVAPAYLAQPPLWWLAGYVMLWVGGFDVIYALADLDTDRREGLHSIPAKLGVRGSLIVARIAHAASLVMLTMAYQTAKPTLGPLFFAGICIVGILLVIEHRAASAGLFNTAFFTVNGVISVLLGALGIADILT